MAVWHADQGELVSGNVLHTFHLGRAKQAYSFLSCFFFFFLEGEGGELTFNY